MAGWVKVSRELLYDPSLSDGALRLLLILQDYSRQDGYCWPGLAHLAEVLGVTERTALRRLRELQRKGFISRRRRYMRSAVTYVDDNVCDKNVALECDKNVTFPELCDKNVTSEGDKNVASDIDPENKKQQHGAGGQTEQEKELCAALTKIGVEPEMARRLAQTCDRDQVMGWVGYVSRAKGLTNAAGLAVRRLLDGIPAPTEAETDNRYWWVGTEFEGIVQF